MKTKKEKKEAGKFDIEKFEVAKLKNLHLIIGGKIAQDDPIDTNDHNGKKDSSVKCHNG